MENAEARIAPAAVVGSVFLDANGDGIQQPTEPGLAGIRVYLDLNNNGKFDPPANAGSPGEPFSITNQDGKYAITTTATGSVTVAQVLPPGFTQTTPVPGPVMLGGPTTIIQGPTFGDEPPPTPPPLMGGTIHGAVFVDANGDGIRENTEVGEAGVIVFIDANGDGKFNPPNTTNGNLGDPFVISAPDGTYEFHVNKDGDYPVMEVAPQGWTQTAPIPAPGPVHVAGGAVVNGPLFGNEPPPPPPPPPGGVIHGAVFVDANGDGIRENTEVGEAGVIVFIDANGDGKFNPPSTATGAGGDPFVITGPNGTYEFHVNKDGDYPVMEVTPQGWTQTAPNPAPGPVHVAGGAVVNGPLFGNQPPPAPGAVTGRVFFDINNNGKLDPGEPGIAGIRVYDDANANGKFDNGERFTFSGFLGHYDLVLPPGTHTLKEVIPNGAIETVAPGPLTVVSGQTIANADFGLSKAGLGSLYQLGDGNNGGTIYWDGEPAPKADFFPFVGDPSTPAPEADA